MNEKITSMDEGMSDVREALGVGFYGNVLEAIAKLKLISERHRTTVEVVKSETLKWAEVSFDWERSALAGRSRVKDLKAELESIAIALEWPGQDEGGTLLDAVKEAACNGVLLCEARGKLARIEAGEEDTGSRPMSQAPKDGTWIEARIHIAFIGDEWVDSGTGRIDADRCEGWLPWCPQREEWV